MLDQMIHLRTLFFVLFLHELNKEMLIKFIMMEKWHLPTMPTCRVPG